MLKKGLIVLFVIPMLLFSLFGCQSSDKKGGSVVNESAKAVDGNLKPLKKQTTVVIAEDGSASGAGFYIANELGYFKDYNIKIKFASFANSDDMLPALSAGKVDIAGGISSASFFNSIAQGINVRMIADKGHNIQGKSYFSFVIRKDLKDKIKTYKDLKGKKVAISTKNAVDDYIFQQMLNHSGLKRSDVHIVLMPDFGNMMAALGNGSIDAALQIEPLLTKGIASGIQTKLGDTTDFAPKAQVAMVLGSPEFLDDNHDTALRFMVAYLKGVRAYNDAFFKGKDKDKIIKIMKKYTALKDEKTWEEVDVAGLDPNGKMFVGDIKNQYEWYHSRGGISGKVDLNKAVDTSLAKQAVKILGTYH